jgi:hypothetical protein
VDRLEAARAGAGAAIVVPIATTAQAAITSAPSARFHLM